MSPATHFLFGWMVAQAGGLERRERAVVALAGVAPDVDGLGVIAEVLTRNSAHPLLWFTDYHHALHNLAFGVVVAAIAFAIARSRWMTAALALLSLHLHLLCDIAGARGPEGYGWPIPYLSPFNRSVQLTWSGQWPLNGWQNFAITGALLLATFYFAWRRGFSPLEMVSAKADRTLVRTLRNRFGEPMQPGTAATAA